MTRREEIEKASICQYQIIGTIGEQEAFKNGFVKGAEWADKTMIEKAYEWLKLNAEDYVVTCYDKGELDSEGLLMDFRKAMQNE